MVLASSVITQSPPLIKIPRARLLHSCKTGKRLYLHLKEKRKNLKLEVAKRNALRKDWRKVSVPFLHQGDYVFIFNLFFTLTPFPHISCTLDINEMGGSGVVQVDSCATMTLLEIHGVRRVCDNDMEASAHTSQGRCDKCDTLTPLNTAYTYIY